MALLTSTEVTVYSNISASAVTIAASGLIDVIQERVTFMTNNYFVSELFFEDNLTFNGPARTIITGTVHFEEYNFLAGDDIFIYGSYRNDGYKTLLSVSENTATLVTGQTVVEELSGQSILLSVVKWPVSVKQIAARMLAYDYDTRPSRSYGLKSRSLGPLSESFSSGGIDEMFGYPVELIDGLSLFRIARLM